MHTGLTLDQVAFLKQVVADIQSDIRFAYGGAFNALRQERCHPVLQRISGKMEVLDAFISATNKVQAPGASPPADPAA